MARAMTKAQQEHAIRRLQQLKAEKKDAIITRAEKRREKERDTYPASFLTVEQAFKRLKDGKLKLRKRPSKRNSYSGNAANNNLDVFFEGLTNPDGFSNFREYIVYKDNLEPELEAIDREAMTVEDQIMLGDQERALELLESFAF